MLPPCFDIEEMSSDVNDIASAVDESGSAVIFKSGIPVYQVIPYKRFPGDAGDARAILEKEIVSDIVHQWMDAHTKDPEYIGINNLLLRLAVNSISPYCYTDELSDLDDLLEQPEPQHDEIVDWILSHLTK